MLLRVGNGKEREREREVHVQSGELERYEFKIQLVSPQGRRCVDSRKIFIRSVFRRCRRRVSIEKWRRCGREEKRGKREAAERGLKGAARPDDTVIRALTFNEAVLHTRLIYSPVQRSIVPFEPAESSRWLFKDSSVDETSDLVRVCTRFHVWHARLEDQRGWGLGNEN